MLSKRIAYLRKKSGISQSQLAARLNISPSAVGMYEQGRRMPDLMTAAALAEALGVSLDYLATGSDRSCSSLSPEANCPCIACSWAQK